MEYWKAIYTKDNIRKKNKRFVDGFLQVDTARRLVDLFDEDGQKRASARSATIIDDKDKDVQYLFVNAFYVELDYRIGPDDFTSGVCFDNSAQLKPIEQANRATSTGASVGNSAQRSRPPVQSSGRFARKKVKKCSRLTYRRVQENSPENPKAVTFEITPDRRTGSSGPRGKRSSQVFSKRPYAIEKTFAS